jgi:hypothetical protein
LKWAAERNPEGVALYISVRAQAPQNTDDADHRVGFFVGLLPEQDEIASPLAALALYSWREQVHVGHGDTIPADEPLWTGTTMSRFLILRAKRTVVPTYVAPEGFHVQFLQAIPIYQSEISFKKREGTDALLDRWEAMNTPFWDSHRQDSDL